MTGIAGWILYSEGLSMFAFIPRVGGGPVPARGLWRTQGRVSRRAGFRPYDTSIQMPPIVAAAPAARATHGPTGSNFSSVITSPTTIIAVRLMIPSTS